jgi:hypothetical protein
MMTEEENKKQRQTGCQLLLAIIVGGILLYVLSLLFNPSADWVAILITICLFIAERFGEREKALTEKSILAEEESLSNNRKYYAAREAGYYAAKADSSRLHRGLWLICAGIFTVLWIHILITGRSLLQAVLYVLQLKETE